MESIKLEKVGVERINSEIWKEVSYRGEVTNKLVSNTGKLKTLAGKTCLYIDNGAGYFTCAVHS